MKDNVESIFGKKHLNIGKNIMHKMLFPINYLASTGSLQAPTHLAAGKYLKNITQRNKKEPERIKKSEFPKHLL